MATTKRGWAHCQATDRDGDHATREPRSHIRSLSSHEGVQEFESDLFYFLPNTALDGNGSNESRGIVPSVSVSEQCRERESQTIKLGPPSHALLF